jgi:VIT1/CCC1 family predicted Fe2+/Mn2+ transporter
MEGANHSEAQALVGGQKLNWLRAAVLGANDGIVSVAALIVGIAAATDNTGFILTAGIAGTISGALSMAAGEYVSVSTQRDTERALMAKEKEEISNHPAAELEELTRLYQEKGLSRSTAEAVAKELSNHDVFAAHAEAELHIDPNNLTNSWYAAFASALSFTLGAIIPVIVMFFSPHSVRIPFTFVAVAVALVITGAWSAQQGGSNKWRATVRVVFGGALAMAITFGVGRLFGVSNL